MRKLALIQAEKTLIILDCCQNQPTGRATGAEAMTDGEENALIAQARDIRASRQREARIENPTVAILNSCREGQKSFEWDARSHGIFTAYLLDAFRETTGSVGAMAAWISDRVSKTAMDLAMEKQIPFFKIEGKGDFQLVIRPTQASPRIEWTPEIEGQPGAYVETEPEGAAVSVDGKGEGISPLTLYLPAGKHVIREEKKGYLPQEGIVHCGGKGKERLRLILREKPRIALTAFPLAEEEAMAVQRAAAEALGMPLRAEEKLGQGAKLRMILISPGTFMMGASDEDSEAFSREKPRHEVTISRAYYLGVYPVTQAEWKAVMGDNPSSNRRGGDYPVESVSWDMVQKFILRLNEKTKKRYRLPTEAEWEYACRAGTEGSRYGELDDIGWYDGNSGGETHPVGKLLPNAFGLYDMLGNVWEWCQDWYGGYDGRAQTDPKGPTSGGVRVLRGGSWGGGAQLVRASDRTTAAPATGAATWVFVSRGVYNFWFFTFLHFARSCSLVLKRPGGDV